MTLIPPRGLTRRTAVGIGVLACILLLYAAPARSATTQSDREFIQQASQAGLAEIDASLMAAENAAHATVREYARHLIADQLATVIKLEAIAQSKRVALPAQPSIRDQAVLRGLQIEPPSTFDQLYLDNFGVEKHEKTVEAFAEHGRETSDPDLRAFVAETLPKLRRHIEMARKLEHIMDTQPS